MRIRGHHRRAFVIQLDPGEDPRAGRFEGRVEHVASGRFTRFRSSEELVAFVAQIVTFSDDPEDEPPQ